MSIPLAKSNVCAGVVYHSSVTDVSCHQLPQPRISPLAHFISVPNDGIGNDAVTLGSSGIRGVPTSGRLLAVNSTYVVYAVKKGLVRVIERHTAAKALLRGHAERTRIVDAQFFGSEGISQVKEGVAALWQDLWNHRSRKKIDTSSSLGGFQVPPAAASDILATVGGMQDDASVLIWRIYGGSQTDDVSADKLIELRFPPAARIIWHPFNPNKFMLLHRNLHQVADDTNFRQVRSVATIVETSSLVNAVDQDHGHVIYDCSQKKGKADSEDEHYEIPGAAQLLVSRGTTSFHGTFNSSLTGANDVSWSIKDARHVLTAHDDGFLRLWDMNLPIVPVNSVTGEVDAYGRNSNSEGTENLLSFQCVTQLQVASTNLSISGSNQVTRVLFLAQYESESDAEALTPPFITGIDMNHTIILWSGFRTSLDSSDVLPPHRLHLFRLKSETLPSLSSLLTVEMCPSPYRPSGSSGEESVPSSFLLLAERANKFMHALHLETQWSTHENSTVVVKGFDFITTLNVVHPVVSLCLAPTNHEETMDSSLAHERDTDLCCMQSKAVQILTLSAAMCAPPKERCDIGELAPGVTLLDLKEEQEDTNVDFVDEEYIIEDYEMQAEEEDDDEAGGAERGHVSITDTNVVSDPLSNWLGAIANEVPPSITSKEVTTPLLSGLGYILPPPPGLTVPSAAAAPLKEEISFLSPMQILSGSESDLALNIKDTGKSRDPLEKKREMAPGKKTKGEHADLLAGKKTPLPLPVAILRREESKAHARPNVSKPAVSTVDLSLAESSIEQVFIATMKSQEIQMIDAVRKAVTSEVKSAIGSSFKDAEKATEQIMQRALSVDGKLSKKLEKAAKESAATAVTEALSAVQGPIVSTLNQTMKEIMIPAFEAATRQMFLQISKSVEQGLSEIAIQQTKASDSTLENMSAQMAKMSEVIQLLTAQVADLRLGATDDAKNKSTPLNTSTTQLQPVDPRREISTLCETRHFEEAFTKAVSAANGDIVLFACKNADISLVFNGEVSLSQTVLICLMQQLGAVLLCATVPEDLKTIVAWLQEIAVTIDPTDENIKRHLGGVVQQLLSNINVKMSSCDPGYRRSLQTLMQVIRGLL